MLIKIIIKTIQFIILVSYRVLHYTDFEIFGFIPDFTNFYKISLAKICISLTFMDIIILLYYKYLCIMN